MKLYEVEFINSIKRDRVLARDPAEAARKVAAHRMHPVRRFYVRELPDRFQVWGRSGLLFEFRLEEVGDAVDVG